MSGVTGNAHLSVIAGPLPVINCGFFPMQ